MNRCFFIGKIQEISDYRFFYNSKVHNAKIELKINTMKTEYSKSELIILNGYDYIADEIYRHYKENDIVILEGEIMQNMEVNILNIELVKN